MASYFDLVFDIPNSSSFTYQVDDKKLASAGKRAMVPFGRRELTGYIIGERDTLPMGVKEESVKKIRRVVDADPLFGTENVELAKWMADYYLCSLGQALSCMIPSGRRAIVPVFPDIEESSEQSLSISDEQAAALGAITKDADNFPQIFYLYGVTGSGKTEVFLRAAQHVLNQNKSVIYLVPEISLTHQTANMIGSRFGSLAATLHSGMTPSTRLSEWVRIRKGDAPIVVGPRSAVFAPVPNLGLIIIDEEHDGSYKSSNTPRYHARQVALKRCQIIAENKGDARLVIGSATPSLEAWKLMEDSKTIKRLDLSRRLSGGIMPKIKAVNLETSTSCITKELKEEILATAAMGRQTILFLNRRGFAYFYKCKSCGYEQTCRSCSVSLTWHKTKNKCICHYCGYSESVPKVCPGCGSVEAGYRGFGTEMIEEEVRLTFPDLRVRRVDADTAGKKGGLEDTLAQFKAGLIDILLGTQMVAKGLNFPGVRLVGVVLADTGLHLPDFRAAERTFSLIVQVAGRAGRYFPDGKVIIQTLRMNDPVIVKSCAMDVAGFYKAELGQRLALNFPPYSRIIRFVIRARDEKKADSAINRLASFAKPLVSGGIDLLGPSECPIGIINNNHRRQLIIRGENMSTIHAVARKTMSLYEKGKDTKVYLEIDVDPVSML
ncbi:MAG: primosomal protein N' [Treponema sp.]|nr:primosomal protein N' [Treponema sp.]